MNDVVQEKRCSSCGGCKPDSEYDLKTRKNDLAPRWDTKCKACRKLERKQRNSQRILLQTPPTTELPNPESAAEIVPQIGHDKQSLSVNGESNIYRRYTYSDGRILELTQEEFERVVRAARILINTERERTGHPLLLG